MMPFERFEKCLKERGLKASLPYSSANPMENLPQCKNDADIATKILNAKNHDSVLISFTAKAESPTLWGLYGGAGAGVCLEFQFPAVPDDEESEWKGQKVAEITEKKGTSLCKYALHKMSYSPDSSRMEATGGAGQMRNLMLYKANEWSFEQEYRFIVPMKWASSCRDGDLYYREPLRYLTAVYLGPHSPEPL